MLSVSLARDLQRVDFGAGQNPTGGSEDKSGLRRRPSLDLVTRLSPDAAVPGFHPARRGRQRRRPARLPRTELATIEVSLVGPDAEAPVDDDDLGFLAGLHSGWDAFVQIILVGLTVLGALLPFLLTAALIAVPAWLIFRPRHVRRPQPPTADVVSEVSR